MITEFQVAYLCVLGGVVWLLGVAAWYGWWGTDVAGTAGLGAFAFFCGPIWPIAVPLAISFWLAEKARERIKAREP